MQALPLLPFTLSVGKDGGDVHFSPEGIIDNNFLVIVAKNRQHHLMQLTLTFHSNCGENGEDALFVSFGLIPQIKTVLAFEFKNLDSQQLFLPRTPGRLKAVVFGRKIKREEVTGISIGLSENYIGQKVDIYDVYMTNDEPEYTVDSKVIVDKLGQTNLYDWKGKTKDEQELKAYLKRQRCLPAASYPNSWNNLGGFSGKKYESTGYFRVEKENGRFFLVDPEGSAFFSVGPDCVIPGNDCRVGGIERFFEELPPKDGIFASAWSVGTHMGRSQSFDFGKSNLIRAFGEKWWSEWSAMTKNRLIKWGFNTVANWSDKKFARTMGMPYVYPLHGFPSTDKIIFRDFPDVFSPEYRFNADSFAEQILEFDGDKNLIGYFLRNEPQWAFVEGLNIAEEMLDSDEYFHSKHAFIRRMCKKYDNDIKNFNAAWNVNFDSFDVLNRKIEKARQLSAAAKQDIDEWASAMIAEYVSVPSAALKKLDRDHLNLGMRYAYIWDKALLSGCENFDVFSINSYSVEPSAQIREVADMTGLPVMIGEFHFGAVDRGLMATGLRGVSNQEERGKAYRRYVEMAAAEPACVGVHYFTLGDQAYLGRFDGENFQIGLVDCCHKPYDEFVELLAETNRGIYDIVFGNKPPSEIEAHSIPRIGF